MLLAEGGIDNAATLITVVISFVGLLGTMVASLIAITKWLQGKIDLMEKKHEACREENIRLIGKLDRLARIVKRLRQRLDISTRETMRRTTAFRSSDIPEGESEKKEND